jgi:hypothetical protein
MKMTNKLAAIAFVASAVLVSGISQVQAADTNAPQEKAATTTTAKKKTTVSKTAPAKATAAASIPWASLDANQKSVLSIGETVWPTIPVEKQKSFMTGADNWRKTSPEDQKKLIDELKTYINAAKK